MATISLYLPGFDPGNKRQACPSQRPSTPEDFFPDAGSSHAGKCQRKVGIIKPSALGQLESHTVI